ncbi:claudin-10 isoform X2 [Triplophysa rosa]|uniref:claudin-10 isoform X2 n=1 Tax=Triplophysa rosa TaxID=992332 RepID=UPI002545CA95|nr:claudin-10 isoform X2 [Triplophysa rosa]
MNHRAVLMYAEIGCFVLCVSGWILVCSTMPTEYWTYSEVQSLVLTSSHYYSNLWKDCISDSTGVTDCKGFPSLLALQSVLALVGMKCTKLGGSETVNARITLSAGINYLLSGLSAVFSYSWYGNKVISAFMDPNYKAKKFELGAALFVGWGGSALLITAGLIYCIITGKEICQTSSKTEETSYCEPSSIYTHPPSSGPERDEEHEYKSSRVKTAYV